MELFEDLNKLSASLNPTAAEAHDEQSKPQKLSLATKILVSIAALFFFIIVLVFKLPAARIQNLVLAHIKNLTHPQGILFNAEKVEIGILLGPSLKLYNVELKSNENEKQVLKINYLRISPKLLSLLSSHKKVIIKADLNSGEISGSLGGSNTEMSVDLAFDQVDLGSISLLQKYLPLAFNGKLNGSIALNHNLDLPIKSEGKIKLSLDKLTAPAQSVAGFNLPKLNINQTLIEMSIAGGVATIRQFEVGKDIKSDDLMGKATGDIKLEKNLELSRLNVKVVFDLSQNVNQSFPLLNALLAPAKTPTGSYAYRLGGPIYALEANAGG